MFTYFIFNMSTCYSTSIKVYYFVNAVVVPSGDSVEVRGVSDWDLNEVDGKLVK